MALENYQDKFKAATMIAQAEGLSGSALEKRVKNLTDSCSVNQLNEQLRKLLGGSSNMLSSSSENEWGHMDVHLSKDSATVTDISETAAVTAVDNTNTQTPAQDTTEISWAPLTEEESKVEVIDKLRTDAQAGIELMSGHHDGFIGKSYDSLKEYLKKDLTHSNVARALYSQNESANILERANNNDLTVNEYLHLNQQLVCDIYPGMQDKTLEEQSAVKSAILSLDPDQLSRMKKNILKLPAIKSPDYTEALKDIVLMLEFETKVESLRTHTADGITVSERQVVQKDAYKLEPEVGDKLVTFEEAFKMERRVDYSKDNVSLCNAVSVQYDLISKNENQLKTAHELLDDKINLVKGNNQFSVSPEIDKTSLQALNGALYQTLKNVAGDDEDVLNEKLKNLSGYDNVQFNNGVLEYIKDEKSPFSISMNSSTAADISKKVLAKMTENSKKIFPEGFTSESVESMLAEAYKNAYGSEQSSQLANAYKTEQENFVKDVRQGVEYTGTAIMIGGMIIYPPAALAGGALASLGGVGVELADEVSKKEGASKERVTELTKELATNGALMAAGFGAGIAGSSAKALLAAKNCPKLAAAAADIGVDTTLSLLSNLAITGDIQLEGEGFSRVMSVVMGHTGKIKAGLSKAKASITDNPKYLKDVPGYKNFYKKMLSLTDNNLKLFTPDEVNALMKNYDAEQVPELLKLLDDTLAKYPDADQASDIYNKLLNNKAVTKNKDLKFAREIIERSGNYHTTMDLLVSMKERDKELMQALLDADKAGVINIADKKTKLLFLLENVSENTNNVKKAIELKASGKKILNDENINTYLFYGSKVVNNPKFSDKFKSDFLEFTKDSPSENTRPLVGLLNNPAADKKVIEELTAKFDSYSKLKTDKQSAAREEIMNMVEKEYFVVSTNAIPDENIRNLVINNAKTDKRYTGDYLYQINNLYAELKTVSDPRIRETIKKQLEKQMTKTEDNPNPQPYAFEFWQLIKVDKALNGNAEAAGEVADFLGTMKRTSPQKAARFEKLIDDTIPEKKGAFRKLMARVGINVPESVSALRYDNELKPLATDYKNNLKLEPMKEWISLNSKTDPKTADYLYKSKYLPGLDANARVLCENISRDFGTKLFFGAETDEAAAKFIYNELFEWKKASGNKANFPPILDLTKIKSIYIRESHKAAGVQMSNTRSVYLNGSGEDLSNLKHAIRHELTHTNDLQPNVDNGKIGNLDIDEIIVHKTTIDNDGNIVKVQKDGCNVPDFEKCKYVEEFKAAGLSQHQIAYAYTNAREFIAIAAEGDMSKYSPGFKNNLIQMGMPEWMFKMKNKSAISTAEEVYEHQSYSHKYSQDDNARISRSTDDIYNRAMNGYDEAAADISKVFKSVEKTGSTMSRVKSLEGLYEKHYRRLEKYDEQIKDAYAKEFPKEKDIQKGKRPATKAEIEAEVKRITAEKAEALNDIQKIQDQIQDSVGMRLVLKDTSPDSIEKVYKELLSAIDNDEFQLLSFSNYCGDGMTPYFSGKMVKNILMHCRKKGYEPEIETPVNINKSTPNYEKQYNTESASRSNGYTTAQMNIKHKNGVVSELQIRGRFINDLAEAEHIIYDVRNGKRNTKGGTAAKTFVSEVESLVLDMEKPENKALKDKYSNYLKKCYEHARCLETGETTTMPDLPKGIDERLDMNYIIKLHKSISC